MAHFELAYELGRLEAVAYENGVETGRTALETAEGSEVLRVQAEYCGYRQNIAVTDQHGAVFTNKQVPVKATVEGALEAWMGTGNPKPLHNYTELITETWNGRAQLILRRKVLAIWFGQFVDLPEGPGYNVDKKEWKERQRWTGNASFLSGLIILKKSARRDFTTLIKLV